jgi:hypothetical protein
LSRKLSRDENLSRWTVERQSFFRLRQDGALGSPSICYTVEARSAELATVLVAVRLPRPIFWSNPDNNEFETDHPDGFMGTSRARKMAHELG